MVAWLTKAKARVEKQGARDRPRVYSLGKRVWRRRGDFERLLIDCRIRVGNIPNASLRPSYNKWKASGKSGYARLGCHVGSRLIDATGKGLFRL